MPSLASPMRYTRAIPGETDFQELSSLGRYYTSARCELMVVQNPADTRALSTNQRARGHKWPLEPPPVIELSNPDADSSKWLYIHNPNLFCVAELLSINSSKPQKKNDKPKETQRDNLHGQLASSLHKIKKPEERNERGYFVFADLNVRDAGEYKLRFTLFEMRHHTTTNDQQVYAAKISSAISTSFTVHGTRAMVQTKESTPLSRLLSESGIKIRLRKESTKRKPYAVDWSSRSHDAMVTNVSQNMLPPIYGNNRDMTQSHELGPPLNRNMGPPQMVSNRMSKMMGEDVSDRLHVEQRPLNSLQYSLQDQRPLSTPQYSVQEQNNQHYHQQQQQQQHLLRHPQDLPQQYLQHYPEQYQQQHPQQPIQNLRQLPQSPNGLNSYPNQAGPVSAAQINGAYVYWGSTTPGTDVNGSMSTLNNSATVGKVIGGPEEVGDWRTPTTAAYQTPTTFYPVTPHQRRIPTSSAANSASIPTPNSATPPARTSNLEPDPEEASAPAQEDPTAEGDSDVYRNANGHYESWRGPPSWE